MLGITALAQLDVAGPPVGDQDRSRLEIFTHEALLRRSTRIKHNTESAPSVPLGPLQFHSHRNQRLAQRTPPRWPRWTRLLASDQGLIHFNLTRQQSPVCAHHRFAQAMQYMQEYHRIAAQESYLGPVLP